jgi:hydrogenase nickel incorporation protein HypA/HybF
MHEFSIAQDIIEIVRETADKNNLREVQEIVLEIGQLAGIEVLALETAIECLKPGTVLGNASVKMQITEGMAECRACRHRFVTDDLLIPCPRCGSYAPVVISGHEMRVKSITAE